MREGHRLLLIIGAIVFIGVVAGCSVFTGTTNENANWNNYAQYYVGTRGIDATFQDMPTRLYYYGTADTAGNTFTFGINVHNRGASFTRGGVYISGFNPQMIKFQELPNLGTGAPACGLSIGNIGFGQLGGIFQCDGVQISGGNGITNVNINNLGKVMSDIVARDGSPKWMNTGMFANTQIQFTNNPTGTQFNVGFNQGDISYYQHGRLFIYFLAGIDFIKNGGREFLLAGNTYDYPGGEEAYFPYTGQIVDWSPGLDQTSQTFMLTTCYQYTTYAAPVICVDPFPESDNRKVCVPKSTTWGGGNGAPVAITSIEQENTPQKIIFHINVRNIGTGTVYDPGQLEKCSPWSPQRTNTADLNVVYLGDVRIGTIGLQTSTGPGAITCSPTVIRLDPTTKSGSTTCTYPISQFSVGKSAYQTPLEVELWYGYSETQQRIITIKRVT